jgi:uncharacterized membrane protein YhaH (DUF805 family)
MAPVVRSALALLFPLRGRRSPGGYGRATLAYAAIVAVVWIVALSSHVRALGFLALLVTAFVFISAYFIGAQRCRDLALPGWAILGTIYSGAGLPAGYCAMLYSRRPWPQQIRP